MPRSPRIEFPGAMYHVSARSNSNSPHDKCFGHPLESEGFLQAFA